MLPFTAFFAFSRDLGGHWKSRPCMKLRVFEAHHRAPTRYFACRTFATRGSAPASVGSQPLRSIPALLHVACFGLKVHEATGTKFATFFGQCCAAARLELCSSLAVRKQRRSGSRLQAAKSAIVEAEPALLTPLCRKNTGCLGRRPPASWL